MLDFKEKLVTSEIGKLVPVLGKENAERLNRAYLIGDEDTRKRIFELIDVMKAAVLSDKDIGGSVLMEPMPKEIAMRGEMELGTVVYGKKRLYPFLLDKQPLLTHIGIFGSSGYGKTNISYWLIEKLSELNIPVLIFDFSKRNYRDLLTTKLKDKIDIFTVGRNVVPIKFNPLIPPAGIPNSQWMKEFSSIFDHAYWLLGGGRAIILKALDSIYNEKKNPTLTDLKKWVNDYADSRLPPRERNWIATASRPLDSLCFKELGEVFSADKGINPSEFFQEGKITILELDALSTNDRTFFIEIILQWIRDWLLTTNKREELTGVIVLEEAHHVLNREKSNKTGSETVIDLVFREVRELGMGIIYTDQHPSLISYPALGNTSTQIYMNLGLDTKHSSDILDAANMLGLDYENERNYIRKLPVGNGLVLFRNSEFPNPFVMSFHKFEIRKGLVTDENLRKFMRNRIDEMYERQPEKQNKTPDDTTKDNEELLDVRNFDEKEWNIIRTLGEGKGAYTSQIYKLLSISGKVFNDRVRRLMDYGLVGAKQGKIGKNKMIYYFLTGKGLGFFKKHTKQTHYHYNIDLANILEMASSVGWSYDRPGSRFIMKHNGKEYSIIIVTETDRQKIHDIVKSNHYFLCANEKIKNIVIQESANDCYQKGRARIIFAALLKKFEDTGRLEKVSIS